jgi:hypothetical protein
MMEGANEGPEPRKRLETESSASETPAGPGVLSWEDLAAVPHTVLKDEGHGAAQVRRYDLPEGPVVVKAWDPPGRVASWWARMLVGREIRHYQILAGMRGIPRLVGVLGPSAFALQYIAGERLSGRMDHARMVAGLDDLTVVLRGLHERRFVHLDLHQKRNVLVDECGAAWLVDLGQGLDCSRGWRRLLFGSLANIDRAGLSKFRVRYAPETIDPAKRDALVDRYGTRRRRPYLNIPRRLIRRLFARDG